MREIKPDVPIVMLSGHLERPHDIDGNVDAYLVKGINPEALLNEIDRLLRLKEHRCQAMQ
jgi:two-component SAPR family response regulator